MVLRKLARGIVDGDLVRQIWSPAPQHQILVVRRRAVGEARDENPSTAVGRLHDRGMICDPVGKVKSVVFTDEGLERSEALFTAMFTKRP